MERRGYRIDRRSGVDRRKVYDLNYFIDGGVERRKLKERRSKLERRKNWIRVDEWISVFVGDPARRAHRDISGAQNMKVDKVLSSDMEQLSEKRDTHDHQF